MMAMVFAIYFALCGAGEADPTAPEIGSSAAHIAPRCIDAVVSEVVNQLKLDGDREVERSWAQCNETITDAFDRRPAGPELTIDFCRCFTVVDVEFVGTVLCPEILVAYDGCLATFINIASHAHTSTREGNGIHTSVVGSPTSAAQTTSVDQTFSSVFGTPGGDATVGQDGSSIDASVLPRTAQQLTTSVSDLTNSESSPSVVFKTVVWVTQASTGSIHRSFPRTYNGSTVSALASMRPPGAGDENNSSDDGPINDALMYVAIGAGAIVVVSIVLAVRCQQRTVWGVAADERREAATVYDEGRFTVFSAPTVTMSMTANQTHARRLNKGRRQTVFLDENPYDQECSNLHVDVCTNTRSAAGRVACNSDSDVHSAISDATRWGDEAPYMMADLGGGLDFDLTGVLYEQPEYASAEDDDPLYAEPDSLSVQQLYETALGKDEGPLYDAIPASVAAAGPLERHPTYRLPSDMPVARHLHAVPESIPATNSANEFSETGQVTQSNDFYAYPVLAANTDNSLVLESHVSDIR